MKRTLLLFAVFTLMGTFRLKAQDFGAFASAVWLTNCSTSNFFNTTGEGASSIGPPENVFTNTNLGVYIQNSNTLILRGGEVKTYKTPNVTNVCSVRMNYRIYLQSGTPGSFNVIDFPFFNDCNTGSNEFPSGGPCSEGDQKWQRVVADGTTTPYAPVNLTNYTPGDYVLEVYYDVTGNHNAASGCEDTVYVNNSGQNYKAFFSIRATPVFSFENPSTCNGNDGYITISGLNPDTNYTFDYAQNGTAIGSQIITANNEGIYTISNLTQGVYSNFSFLINNCITNITTTITLSEPIIDAPVSAGDITECMTNPAQTITALATPPDGSVIVWYDAAVDGNIVNDPSLNNVGTVTYYAESQDSVLNCISTTRTAVTLTINATPEAPTVEIILPDCDTPTGIITITSPVGTLNPPSDLFISEITDESVGSLTYIEIFNGTETAKNLNNYIIKIYNNGNDYTSCELPLSGIIDNNTVKVISIGSNANQGGVVPDYVFSQCAGVNTNDNIRLTSSSGEEIDLWGRTDGVHFTPNNETGYTYRRIPTATVPSLNWNPDDWIAIDPQDYSDVGNYDYLVNSGSYEYSIDGTNYQTETVFNEVEPGVYQVTVRDAVTFCVSEATEVTIIAPEISETPEFEFGNEISICSGSETPTLPTTSQNGIAGSWSPETISNTQNGTYTFTSDNECADNFTLLVTVNPVPDTPQGDSTQSICSVATVIFNLNDLTVNGNNLQWYADETLNTPLPLNTPLVNDTTYYVTQTINGCESEPLAILVFLYTTTTPEFEFGNEISICSGSEVPYLPETSQNGIAGSWSPETIDNTQNGTYTFTSDNECADNFTLLVTVNPVPETPEGDSTQSICSDATVIFNLSDLTVNGNNLQWYANETLNTPLPSNTTLVNNTTYYVTQTVNGCESEPLAILVFVNNWLTPDFEFGNEISICSGSEVPYLPETSQNGITGSWFPETISNTQNGVYIFTPNPWECADGFTLTVSINQAVEFEIDWACVNETFQLQIINASENASFEWTLASGQTVGNNASLNVTQYLASSSETLPVTFYANVTSGGECSETKYFVVESVHCGIQKGISPNNDFLNDSFDLSLLNVKNLSIFNRYGIKVYEKENYTSEWVGQTNNGKELPDATYYYVIEFRNGDTKTGWIYINRETGR